MSALHWVRLWTSERCGLRLGGWYRATALTAREAHVSVRGQLVKVSRALLEVRVTPPSEWTVVRGPLAATRLGGAVRDGYLVCPNCRHRDPLPGTCIPRTRCARCNEVFPVAWSEPYPRSTEIGRERPRGQPIASQETIPPPQERFSRDRRMARRRSSFDRRRSVDRRSAARRALALGSVVVVGVVVVERRVAAGRRGVGRRSGRDRRAVNDRRQRMAIW